MILSFALTLLHLPTLLYCQNSIVSEVAADTCITFTKPNSTGAIYIKRYSDSLCVFISGEVFPKPDAWNRVFSCNESFFGLSVCFSDTKTSDSAVFYFIVGSNQESYTTLVVEYPPSIWSTGTQKIVEGENLNVTCAYSQGKPIVTTFYWTRANDSFLYHGQFLWIPSIARTKSGTYTCFAENTYSSGNKGVANATIEIDVQYPPYIQPFDTMRPVEGETLVIPCNVTDGNPAATYVHWTRVGYSLNYNGANYTMPSVRRSHSGTYTCHAQNTYYDSTRGEANQSVTVDVEYPPAVTSFSTQYPTEHSDLSVRCSATPGNPSNHVYYWTRLEDSSFQQNNTYLQLYGISRNESGSYTCTAVNSYSTGGEGKDSKSLTVNVQYPPVVSPLSNVKYVEGEYVSILCKVTSGNPSSSNIYWISSGYSGFRQYGSTLTFNGIGRSQSGTYSCVAENNYNIGGKGTNQQSFFLDVLYGPTLIHGQTLRVSEGQYARMSTSITSNPASSVSWFRDNVLVATQQSVNGTTSYTITGTQCTDTGSFRVVASNGVQSNHSTTVSLYVYCSPRIATGGSSVELFVGSNRYLNGQVSVLSYPQPNASLTLPSGAPNTLIYLRIIASTTNLFTITLTRSNLQSDDFGTYALNVANQYGRRKIYVNIVPISKPFPSTKVLITCGNGQALVTWQSSYFGYEKQYSVVQYSIDNVRFINGSDVIVEDSKEEILQTSVRNLQDSTLFFFRVFTSNTYGFSTSISTNCSTATTQESSFSTAVVVGSVLGALLFLAIGAVVFISYKYLSERKVPARPYDPLQREKAFVDHTYESYEFSDQDGKGNESKELKKEEKNTKKLKAERLDDLEKSTVENHTYDTSVQNTQGVLQKTSKNPKKFFFKPLFHRTPKDTRKPEDSKLEALGGAALKEYSSSKSNFEVERVYENTRQVAKQVCNIDTKKNKGSKEADLDKEHSKDTKTKPEVLPKPKKGGA